MDDIAWDALRATARKLDRSRYKHFPVSSPGGRPLKSSSRTGYSPLEAEASLVSAGLSTDEARRQVGETVRVRAEAVVRSWTPWIESYGFIDEMFRLPPETLKEFLHHHGWDDLQRRVVMLATYPAQWESDPALRDELSNRVTDLVMRDAPHPAFFMLIHLHGLPAGLAEAACLRHRFVVSWAPLAMVFLLLLFPFVALISLIPVLAGRARIFPPLLFAWAFTFLITLAVATLVREPPFRRPAWRKRVARWREETAARYSRSKR